LRTAGTLSAMSVSPSPTLRLQFPILARLVANRNVAVGKA
jgi:hypothetical protein